MSPQVELTDWEETPKYYAKTRFWQNGEEFVCVPPFQCAEKFNPTTQDVWEHLLDILKHNDYSYWGKDGVKFNKSSLNFGDMEAKRVATLLANPMNNQPVNGITYEIATEWVPLPSDGTYDRTRHQDL
jgi:hypothetical protein